AGDDPMQRRNRVWMMVGAGLCVAVWSGLLLARGQDNGRPATLQRGDLEARNEGPSGGQDAQMAIGHALAMAIEGSSREALALQWVGTAGSPGMAGGFPGGAAGVDRSGTGGAGTSGSDRSGLTGTGGGRSGVGSTSPSVTGSGTA